MIQQIVSILQTAVALVFMFAVLVMFHELGHYLSARAVGMRVEEFAFGFGPKLIRLFKRGDTEYDIRAFPLGGFVKIAGMEPGQEDIADGFQAQSIPKRAFVIFSGPFASLLLGMVVFIGLGLFWGYPIGETTNRVGMVLPGTEAKRLDLRAGDRITQINGTTITNGEQMTGIIHNSPGTPIQLVVVRSGEQMKLTATPRYSIMSYLGANWGFMDPTKGVIEAVVDNSPAAKAGLMADDELVAINGKLIHSGKDMLSAIDASGQSKVSLTIKRGDQVIQAAATPPILWVQAAGVRWYFPEAWADVPPKQQGAIKPGDQLISFNGSKIETAQQLIDAVRRDRSLRASLVLKRDGSQKAITVEVPQSQLGKADYGLYRSMGLLGFEPETKLVKASVRESLSRGLQIPLVILQSLAHINLKKDVGGPILIAKMTHSSVALGPYRVMWLLGGLSMSLAFINLLPIPVVDGGHLALLGLEAIRRKKLTMEQMAIFQTAGIIILMTIMVLVFSSDISKLIAGGVPQ